MICFVLLGVYKINTLPLAFLRLCMVGCALVVLRGTAKQANGPCMKEMVYNR